MKLLIDTNVIMDVLQKRQPFFRESKKVCECCEIGLVDGFISSLSIANIVYVLRRSIDSENVESLVEMIDLLFIVEDTKRIDIVKAAGSKWRDYEDSIQHQIAKRLKLDYIVTRNTKDYAGSDIPVITPGQAITIMS